jgi:hypothetical protein
VIGVLLHPGKRMLARRGGVLYRHRAINRSGRRMTRPTPREIQAIADVAGVPVSADVAERIAHSIGPAFEGFAAVAGTLPFDLEPATFVVVQAAAIAEPEKAAS